MKKRILTGSIMLLAVALFVASRIFTEYAFDLFIGVIAIIGCVEVARVLEQKRMFTSVLFVGVIPAIMYLAIIIGIRNEREWYFYLIYFLVIVVVMFILNVLFTLIFKGATAREKDKYGLYDSNSKYAFKKGMNSTFILVYPALLFSALFLINHYFDLSFVGAGDLKFNTIVTIFYLVFIFAVTMLTDTFALVWGMLIGGPKLCPKISPKKTISGAIGGFIFGALGGLLVYYLFSTNTLFKEAITEFNFEGWKFLIVAAVTSIVGQIGDLIASALKRSARVKDYGTLFPGHGGVMDRVDGLICNAVVVLISMFIMI